MYICGACHDEVLDELPGEVAAALSELPADVRGAKVVAHALSAPSRHDARAIVHARLARDEPEPPAMPPPAPRSIAAPERIRDRAAVVVELALETASPHERAYCETLFDPAALRRHW